MGLSAPLFRPSDELRVHHRDRPPFPREREPEGQAQGDRVAEGAASAALRCGRLGDRPPRPLAARAPVGGARRRACVNRGRRRREARALRRLAVSGRCLDAPRARVGRGDIRLRAFSCSAPTAICRSSAVATGPSPKMAGARMRRVNEAVRAVLSARLAEGLKDPRIGFVTVTGVETTPDLRSARVYVSVLGDESARSDAIAGLRSSRGFLQAQIARELTLKRTPTLDFVYDDSVERGMRISSLLDEHLAEDQ